MTNLVCPECGGKKSRAAIMCDPCRRENKRRGNEAKARSLYLLWKRGDQSVLPENQRRQGFLRKWFRTLFFEDKGNKCERCGWTYEPEDGGLPPLEVSHRDNAHLNMAYDNLELLCPNCHAVERRENPTERGEGRWANGNDTRS